MTEKNRNQALAALLIGIVFVPAISMAIEFPEQEESEPAPFVDVGGYVPPLPITPSQGFDAGYMAAVRAATPMPTTEASTTSIPEFNTEGLPAGFQFTKDLKVGSISMEVKMLQIFLNNNDFPVVASGLGSKGDEVVVFGPKTRAALMKFQEANGLAATGMLDNATRTLINGFISH